MKVTVSHDFDGGAVRIVIEVPASTPPERAAYGAYVAVDDALTALQAATTAVPAAETGA